MKILRFTLLAIVMVFGLFALTAVADQGDRSTALAVGATADSGFAIQTQTPTKTTVHAVYKVDSVFELNKAWVKERVGAMPLNVFRILPVSAAGLDGHRSIAYKPNITHGVQTVSRIGFTGNDAFARAPDL